MEIDLNNDTFADEKLTDEELKYGKEVVDCIKYIWDNECVGDDAVIQIVEAYHRKFGIIVEPSCIEHIEYDLSYKININDSYSTTITKIIVMFSNNIKLVLTIRERLTYDMRKPYSKIANEIIPRETKIYDFDNETNIYNYVSSFFDTEGFLLSKILLFDWIEYA